MVLFLLTALLLLPKESEKSKTFNYRTQKVETDSMYVCICVHMCLRE